MNYRKNRANAAGMRLANTTLMTTASKTLYHHRSQSSRPMTHHAQVDHAAHHAGRHPRGLERYVVPGRLIGFSIHLIVFWMVCLLVLVTAGFFPALTMALSWGIGLACHGFFALVVPWIRSGGRPLATLPRAAAVAASPTAPLPAAMPVSPLDEHRARALEELSASIAHEIRNPITAAKSLVQQIAEDPTAPETVEHARVVIGELDRVERSIAHLLRFAREEPFDPRPLNVTELIDSAIDWVRERAQRQHVRLERELDGTPSLIGDVEQLRKVLANLIGNALDAHTQMIGADPFVRITAGRNLAGDEVWIRVTDNGPGIPAAVRGKIFQPFFTSKPGGTGLGLALAHKVLTQHGGTIELVLQATPGATFLLVLPTRPVRAVT
jgi:signal transduction histidine kinase